MFDWFLIMVVSCKLISRKCCQREVDREGTALEIESEDEDWTAFLIADLGTGDICVFSFYELSHCTDTWLVVDGAGQQGTTGNVWSLELCLTVSGTCCIAIF